MIAPSRLVLIAAIAAQIPAGVIAQTVPGDAGDLALDQVLAPISPQVDDALSSRVLGALWIAPAAQTAHAVRATRTPGHVRPPRGARVEHGTAQRPSPCGVQDRESAQNSYWELRATSILPAAARATTPPAASADAAPTSTRAAPGPWCEQAATRPAAFAPVARAIWAPLLIVVLGTLAFWATRGFRSP